MKPTYSKIIISISSVLIIFALWLCISRSTKLNLNCIQESNIFQFEYVQRIELSPDVFSCYQNLLDKKLIETFIVLEQSSNPVARAYGVWGHASLLDTQIEKATFLKGRICEMDSVTIRYYDVIYATTLGSLYFDLAYENMDKFVINELKLEIIKKNYNHIDTIRNE